MDPIDTATDDTCALPAPAGDERPHPPGTELGLMQGQLLGPPNRRYRLERLIACGAMGQVWQATDLATQAELGHSAQVALKVLAPALTENGAHAKLLVQEATRARRLAHEHIVRVYDWALDPATASYFVIMECLEGEDFAGLLARAGRLPLARVLTLLAPVGAALEHAWDKHGLVHRDIKPANVFLTTRGEVKLLDFGIAARARARARAGERPVSAAGRAAEAPPRSGTPGYRAPEAGAPDSLPAPSLDVYAVAAMAHQMLSGQAPDAAGEFARPAGLDEREWQALQSGLAVDPAARPASVAQLLAALAGGEAGAPQPVPGPKPKPEPEPEPEPEPPRAAPVLASGPAELAAAAARAAAVRQRREQEKRERLAGEASRRERREVLRAQLAARRAEALDQARQAQTEEQERTQRMAQQARAAAAYLAEQERASGQAAAPAVDDATTAATAAAPRLLRERLRDGAGLGPELVLLPAGRFQMGSPEHERKIALAAGARRNWLARETPQRWVGIERPFALGRYPVTVGEWRAFVQASGWRPGSEIDWAAPGFPQDERYPVVGVSWHDAQHYLAWLSEQTGARYRLPSEAEWEYACRAGTRSAFSFGDAIEPGRANYDGSFAWNGGARGEFRRGTTPVDRFPANSWGLHDMHGNVWEWVQDPLHEDYAGAPCDGSAWEQGGQRSRRMLRGGCWRCHPRQLRSALRNAFAAAMASDIVGFRVVRELADPGQDDDIS